jgi:hypothetical protein
VRSVASAGAAAPPELRCFFRIFTPIFEEPDDERRSQADELMRAARQLWMPPCARSWTRTPFIARVVPGAPRLPFIGARADMSEPLATVPLGWRMVTLIGVAQLLDLAGARQSLGAPPFTLDELADWTGYGRHAARTGRGGPIDAGASLVRTPPLTADEHWARAETSAFWRRQAAEMVAEHAARLAGLSVEAKLAAMMREAERRRIAGAAGRKTRGEAGSVSSIPTRSHQFRLGQSHNCAPPVS